MISSSRTTFRSINDEVDFPMVLAPDPRSIAATETPKPKSGFCSLNLEAVCEARSHQARELQSCCNAIQ